MRRVKRKTRPATRGRRRSRPPAMSRTALRRVGLVVLWSASLTGIAYGLHRLEPYARAANGDGSWRLEWVDVPATLEDWILEEVEQNTDLPALLQTDIHDPDLSAHVYATLDESPWIAEVHRVSKQTDGVVSVHATVRDYLTFVVKNRVGYLVDKTGVRLPRQTQDGFLPEYEMILVEGAHGPVPEVGRAWPGADVAAGLELVSFLNRRCPDGLRGLLKAVDVSNVNDRLNRRDGWLRIRTIYPGRYVLWGLPPGSEDGVECTAERKLELLWAYYSQYGQLPDRDRIDVRDEDGIDVPWTP